VPLRHGDEARTAFSRRAIVTRDRVDIDSKQFA
jgi:hypothetical protein